MLYPFILTTIASLSTLLGIIPIFIKNKNETKIISNACYFASAIMLSLSILDLIPEGLNYISSIYNKNISIILTIICIIIGIILSNIIDKIINKINNNNLYNIGLLSMIALLLHNIPEGIITYIVSSRNIILGISICISIAIHNIPEGISISVPIYYSTKSKTKAILYTLLSSFGELTGALITYLFLSKYINNIVLGIILNITSGIMIYISINKLIPTANSYNTKYSKLFFILGIIFMLINLLLNNLIS